MCFVNTNLLDVRFQLLLSEKELNELPNNSPIREIKYCSLYKKTQFNVLQLKIQCFKQFLLRAYCTLETK